MIDSVQRIAMWMMAGVAAYVVYRFLSRPREAPLTSYEQDLQEILSSEKYKVKGRFED